MHERAFRRAVALGAAALLLVTTTALADTVRPTTDGVTPAQGGTIDLGIVGPGAMLSRDVAFVGTCAGASHLDPGATVSLTVFTADAPPGGALTASDGSVGPAPSGWAASGCTNPPQTFTGGTASHLALMAPTDPSPPGQPYHYDLLYRASTSSGGGLASSFVGMTLLVTVVADQPPTLHLPAPMTVEGTATGGASVTYSATATDAEDSPPPTPTCAPGSGAFFQLGTTIVGCMVTDTGGNTVSGSFAINVVDTTPPTLAGVPAGETAQTTDATGMLVSYPAPNATDIVDPSPTVACAPASGTGFPVGTTTVTCTATDHSGNSAIATFSVTITLVRLGATFDAPIGPTDTLSINPGRNLPVKVAITRDGVAVSQGVVALALATCGGSPLAEPQPLAFQGDRWFLGLDTAGLRGCVTGTVLFDGQPAGTFTMAASTGGTLARPRHR